jgi:outer membrane protein OmpA-like peptidoglycan-associated protein
MRTFISGGLTLAATLLSLVAFTAPSAAQTITFAPQGGFNNAVPNLAAYGLTAVQLDNGVPVQGSHDAPQAAAAAAAVPVPIPLPTPTAVLRAPAPRVAPLALMMPAPRRFPALPFLQQRRRVPVVVHPPVFGQPVFGQPVFGQPVFGQPIMGQPIMGQPLIQPRVMPPLVQHPQIKHQPVILGAAPSPAARSLTLMNSVPVIAGQPYCEGFARASDGSLIATLGGGFASIIVGSDCLSLIRETLSSGQGIVLAASVLFDGNSDTISLTAKRALELTAEAIKASGGQYDVVGYASHDGDRIANDYLSWRRAKAAAYSLIHEGVATTHLSIIGKGETRQFGETLAVNRRVVIRRKA